MGQHSAVHTHTSWTVTFGGGKHPPRRRARLGRGAGRGRSRRSGRTSCSDRTDLPRADRPCTSTAAVPAGGFSVHALAGGPRFTQSARRITPRQRVVEGG